MPVGGLRGGWLGWAVPIVDRWEAFHGFGPLWLWRLRPMIRLVGSALENKSSKAPLSNAKDGGYQTIIIDGIAAGDRFHTSGLWCGCFGCVGGGSGEVVLGESCEAFVEFGGDDSGC